MSSFTIRDATREDTPAIAALYAHYVRTSPATFELEAPDAREIERRRTALGEGYPWLVAEDQGAKDAGELLGYAYAGMFRTRPAYRWTTEVTVYVAHGAQRRGIGRALYAELLRRVEEFGYRMVIAGITLPNEASVGFHEDLGFRPAARYREVGRKFNTWHDVGFWQLELRPGEWESPAEPGQGCGA